MIADAIPFDSKSAVSRGLPVGSIWRVRFSDGSYREETDTSWAAMSRLEKVEYFGMKKSVMLCVWPVSHIWAEHDGLRAEIAVPEGFQVFQAIRSSLVMDGQRTRTQILGRCIGLVKDGKVAEELFLNGMTHEVLGVKA